MSIDSLFIQYTHILSGTSLIMPSQMIEQQFGFLNWEDILNLAGVSILDTADLKSCSVHRIIFNLALPDGDSTARLLLSALKFAEPEIDKILEVLADIMQKAPLENRKKLVKTFPAPSKVGGSSYWNTATRHTYAVSNHRYCNAVSIPHSVPVSLLCKEFGEFQDILRDSQPREFLEYIPLALQLMQQMSHIYESEAERVEVLMTTLAASKQFHCKKVEETRFKTDLSLFDEGGKVRGNLEIRNELGGMNKSPTLQQVGYVFALHSRDDDFAPLLLISSAGPEYFQVHGAAWYGDRLCIDQLSNPLSLLHEPHSQDATAKKLACVLYAIQVIVNKLSKLQPTGFLLPYYHYTNSQSITLAYPLKDKVCVWKASLNERVVVVKFVCHYGIEVHRYLASENMAPSVLHTEKLPGGWIVVVMDYVDGESPVSLETDNDRKKFGEFKKKLKDALKRKEFVHGDLRSPNIIKCGDKFMVIDFDWAGKNGEVEYPITINMKQSRWHHDVKPCHLIVHAHDEFQLDMIQLSGT